MNFERFWGCRICWFAMAVGLMSHVLVITKSHADEIVIDDNAFTDSFVRILSNFEDSRLSAGIFSNPARAQGGFRLPSAEGAILVSDGDIYAHCLSAVVLVGSIYQCGKCSKWHSRGFAGGWIASAEGHIVTNYHVLDAKKNDRIGVMMFDGRVFPVKSVCVLDEVSDSASLKIDPAGEPLPFLRLGNDVRPGDSVSIISHPSGRLWYLTKGVVARFSRRASEKGSSTWMSVTADYALGSSGCPVLNETGEVVGMVSTTTTLYTQPRPNMKNGDPQMVVRECVSLSEIRDLLLEKSPPSPSK